MLQEERIQEILALTRHEFISLDIKFFLGFNYFCFFVWFFFETLIQKIIHIYYFILHGNKLIGF